MRRATFRMKAQGVKEQVDIRDQGATISII